MHPATNCEFASEVKSVYQNEGKEEFKWYGKKKLFAQIPRLLLYVLISSMHPPISDIWVVDFFFKEWLAIDSYPISQYLSFKFKMASGIKEVSLEHIFCSSHWF